MRTWSRARNAYLVAKGQTTSRSRRPKSRGRMRESVELIDARSRRELAVAQRKNLRIARFLNRIVFCFFAEKTGLLPKNVVTDIFKTGVDDPAHFAEVLEDLFQKMAKGGTFGPQKIRHFNGHLFEEATVFELTEPEISKLAVAG